MRVMRCSLLVLVVFFVFAPSAVNAAKPSANPCPITSNTNIVVYGDTGFGGVGSLSKSWITHFLDWWKAQDLRVNYVFLDATDVKTDCNFANYPNVKLYIQPGGDAYYQQRSLGSVGKVKILDFIDIQKGSYLGICAGFYYAAGDYYWQGRYYNWADLLERFPTLEGSITDIADYDSSPGYAMTPLSNGFNAIYYGGPTRGWKDTENTLPSGASKVASFSAIQGEVPAIVQYGKMLFTSVHLEAFENDGITGLSTEQRAENYKLLGNLINQVSGLGFAVPGYAEPPPDDDNPPGTLLSDGFEDGTLTGWTLLKASGANAWQVSSVNPYQGGYAAQAKPMSSTTPASIMERGVSTVGYSTVTVSYYRRLVGLDIADEFQAKWFDGTSWQILEQTGSASANDAAYVYKTYTLPATAGNNAAFKIRFECTAGATSEYCRIDNVVVKGQ